MAYSTNLALALPVQGTLPGAWGTTVNDNITNMLDEALGYQAYTASGSTDTLTIPNGVTGVARSIYIQLNGAGGGIVEVPATKTKMYFVFNNTSSAITFKVTGMTGVSIPAAAKMALVSNGTDIIVAQNYFSALTLGAALPVASGGTGLASGTSGGVLAYTASGTLASSSALAANALVIGGGAGAAPSTTTTGTGVVTALGVNTGSAGAFVVNGGALGTPSSGTVTNLTGTASININGTVGATTPGTGAFTTLTTSSTVTHNGGTANGVAYLNGSKVLTTGSALVFDGANLGLGVTPSAWSTGKGIEVGFAGSGVYSYSQTDTEFLSNAYYNAGYKFGGTGRAMMYAMGTAGAGIHSWHTSSASGTAGDPITFTQAMTLDASGNLGIGTTSPSTYSAYTKLSVLNGIAMATNATDGGVLVGATTTGTELAYLSMGRSYNLGSTGEIVLATNGAKPILFGTSNTERARIDSSGNLLVGTTSAVSGGGVLQVSNGITFPATQSASTDANTLDDYEEGTFTPTLGGTAVYDIQTGRYTKIGRLVYFFINLRPSSLGTGSTNTISGLPFAVGDGDSGCAGAGYSDGAANNYYSLTFDLGGSSSTSLNVCLRTSSINSLGSSATAFFQTNTRIFMSGVYAV